MKLLDFIRGELLQVDVMSLHYESTIPIINLSKLTNLITLRMTQFLTTTKCNNVTYQLKLR